MECFERDSAAEADEDNSEILIMLRKNSRKFSASFQKLFPSRVRAASSAN